ISSAKTASDKISSVLPDGKDVNVALRVSDWHQIPESDLDPKTARHLIRDERKIEIDYHDISGNRTMRIIKPIALLYYIDVILLAGWCELREGFRHFRIDRVRKWKITGDDFKNTGDNLRRQWEEHL
ncbi:MAG: WYL domain-containing protein, partial [Pseudomonadota bacterium]